MNQSQQRSNYFQDQTRALQLAIEKIEHFSRQNSWETIPDIQHLNIPEGKASDQQTSPLQKTIQWAKGFIAATFSDKVRSEQEKKKNHLQQELLEAIAVVKSLYNLIQKLTRGDLTQQKLAASALAAIKRYNELVSQACKSPPTWSRKIAKFLYEKMGLAIDSEVYSQVIELPDLILSDFEDAKKNPQRFYTSLPSISKAKISDLMQQRKKIASEDLPTKREEDAFRMKAITLLRNYGGCFTSLSEEMHSIRMSPIHAIANSEGIQNADSIISMYQMLIPLPGEVIELKGSFKRTSKAHWQSIPIPESFHLTPKSLQTGYPHPSQHTGWALCDLLIPDGENSLPGPCALKELCERKERIAQDLKPNGRLNAKAKQLLKLKKHDFQANKAEFLNLHLKLNEAFFNAAGCASQETQQMLTRYFEEVANLPTSYDYLSEVENFIVNHFIVQPYEKLKKEGLDREHPDQSAIGLLQNACAKCRQEIDSQKKEDESTLERCSREYIIAKGSLLSIHGISIILHHAEGRPGPSHHLLTPFAQRLRISVYKQLMEFLDELEHPNSELGPIQLKQQLQADIEVFAKPLEALDIPAAAFVYASLG